MTRAQSLPARGRRGGAGAAASASTGCPGKTAGDLEPNYGVEQTKDPVPCLLPTNEDRVLNTVDGKKRHWDKMAGGAGDMWTEGAWLCDVIDAAPPLDAGDVTAWAPVSGVAGAGRVLGSAGVGGG